MELFKQDLGKQNFIDLDVLLEKYDHLIKENKKLRDNSALSD
jgi:hypothetical protein